MYDIAIIGGGVVGTSIARELSRYKLSIAILEKGTDLALGTTKANSAIIHAGYDAHYKSLKGKLNGRGNKMFDKVCEELSVPFKRIGSLVLAFDEDDCKALENLKQNGLNLRIPGIEIISAEDIRKLEPNLSKDAIKALYAPTAGIIEPWELAIAYGENAIDNGAELKLSFEVTDIEEMCGENNYYKIHSNDKSIEAKTIINCAGVYAEKIYSMVAESHFKITPRRGEYFVLDKEAEGLINHVIFPCPGKSGKGVLMVPTVEGNILIGPNAENLNKDDLENTDTTMRGLNEVKKEAKKLCDNIPYNLNIRVFSGLRAEPSTDDFIIEASDKVDNFINVAGIKSPGLSSVPAIAEMVVNIYRGINSNLIEKTNFNPIRRPRVRFNHLPLEERKNLIKGNPLYGRVICRCEMITEAEIVDTIRRSAGAKTLNGVKRRTRPGAGRCQGSFCGPVVLEILQRELGIKAEEVLLEETGSNIITGHTKEEAAS